MNRPSARALSTDVTRTRIAAGLPRTFWILWTGMLVNRVGAVVITFLAVYLTSERGFPAARAGLVVGVYGIGGAAGTAAGGVLADRWGRRATMLLGQFGQVAATVALGFARDPRMIGVLALAVGFLFNITVPAFFAMIVDAVPDADRGRAHALRQWAYSLGFAVAGVGGGLAAQANYQLIFLIDAGTTLAYALITVDLLTESRPPEGRRPGTPRGAATVARDRPFLGLLILNFGVLLVVFQYLSTLPIAMNHDGYGPAAYGAVIAINGLVIVGGQLFVPRLTGRFTVTALLAGATALAGLGFGLDAVAHRAWFYAVTVAIWTVGQMVYVVPAQMAISRLAPADLRGRYMAAYQLSAMAAVAVATADLLQAQYQDAVAKGATVLVPGGRIDRSGAFFQPAVLTDLTPEMRVYTEEAFGPLAMIYRVADADAAVELANSSVYGLGGTVFGAETEARRVAERLDTGHVGINTYLRAPIHMPFGGTKHSGVGRELGRSGMDQFANIKTYGIA
jgi:predicted MFS family arabinose efflux permease